VTTATLPANEGILDALHGLRTLWMMEAMIDELDVMKRCRWG